MKHANAIRRQKDWGCGQVAQSKQAFFASRSCLEIATIRPSKLATFSHGNIRYGALRTCPRLLLPHDHISVDAIANLPALKRLESGLTNTSLVTRLSGRRTFVSSAPHTSKPGVQSAM